MNPTIVNLFLHNPFRKGPRSTCRIVQRTAGMFAAALFLTTLCGVKAVATPVTFPEVQFVVVVTENLGQAYYLNTLRDTGCQKTTTQKLYHCPLPYTKKGGVPTLDFPHGISRRINPGDILFLEPLPEFLNDPRSDVIRFPADTGKDGGAGFVQFFSKPGDVDTDGSTDTNLPSTNTDMKVIEEDLGLSITVPNLRGGINPNGEIGSLNGKFGWAWIAKQNDAGCPSDLLQRIQQHCSSIGGISASASEGPIFYIFISDTPEPSSLVLFGSGLVGVSAYLRRRPQRIQRHCRAGN